MYNLIKREAIYFDAPKILITKEQETLDPKIEAEKIIKKAENEATKILDSAKREAKNILENAKKEYDESKRKAEEVLAETEKKVEEIKKSIREEVEKKLIAEYEKKFEIQLERLEKLLSEITEKRTLIVEKLIYKLLEIFKLFIEKVSLETVKIDDKVVLKKLRVIANNLVENQKIILKLSPEDKEVFTEDVLEDLKSRFKSVSFKFDDSLKKGDLIVETDFGIYNFTTTEALNILNDIMVEELSEN